MSRVIKSSFISESSNEQKDKTKDKNLDMEKELSHIKEKIINDAKIEKEEILEKANAKSKEIVGSAKRKSEEILEETYDKSSSIIEEYKEKGYNEGYSEGISSGKKESQALIEEAIKIKNENIENKKQIILDLEKDIIELVISSCGEIINRMYDEDREIILSIIQKGIDNLNETRKIIIKSSKYDFDFLEMYKDKILSMTSNIDDIEIVIDKNLDKGGIILESLKGSVDVSINTQLEELELILREILDSERY